MTSSDEARAARVRTGLETAKVRAKRQECRVNVWYSMSAKAPGMGKPGQECVWVRTPDEGPPPGSYLDDNIVDDSAFILAYYDEHGEIHVLPGDFAWYRDATMQGVGDMFLCINCGQRMTDPHNQLMDRLDKQAGGEDMCDICDRPVRMPGL